MHTVIKINISTGELAAYGPFTEIRNARKAAEWHRNAMWHTEIVPLVRVVEGAPK